MATRELWAGEKLTAFGAYIKARGLDTATVAKALEITTSYVSMLARGQANPAFRLAQKVAKWSAEQFGADNAFRMEHWEGQ